MSRLLDGIVLKLRTQLHDVPSLSRPVHHEERDLGHSTHRLYGPPFAIHWIETENPRGTKLDPASTCVVPCRQRLWANALRATAPKGILAVVDSANFRPPSTTLQRHAKSSALVPHTLPDLTWPSSTRLQLSITKSVEISILRVNVDLLTSAVSW